MMQLPSPILIVDPSTLFREGLRLILSEAGFQAVWCSNLPPIGGLPGLSEKATPLLLVGGDMDEVSLHISEVKHLYPAAKVVILAESVTQLQFMNVLRYGADTLLLKHSSCDTLVATLRLAASGVAAFPVEMLDTLVACAAPDAGRPALPGAIGAPAIPHLPGDSGGHFNLSIREREVMALLLRGLSNKEIARGLSITEATVKVHVKAIFRKAKVRNRTQVAIWASRQGLDYHPGNSASVTAILQDQPHVTN